MDAVVLNPVQERAWLESLSHEIWGSYMTTMRTNMDGRKHVVEASELRRKLTDEEFIHLKRISELFMVVPTDCEFGFNFGISLYAVSEYPGIPPTHILCITGSHLPEGMNDRFDGAWESLSPLSHNDHNRNLLAFHGREEPRSKGYYDY